MQGTIAQILQVFGKCMITSLGRGDYSLVPSTLKATKLEIQSQILRPLKVLPPSCLVMSIIRCLAKSYAGILSAV